MPVSGQSSPCLRQGIPHLRLPTLLAGSLTAAVSAALVARWSGPGLPWGLNGAPTALLVSLMAGWIKMAEVTRDGSKQSSKGREPIATATASETEPIVTQIALLLQAGNGRHEVEAGLQLALLGTADQFTEADVKPLAAVGEGDRVAAVG